MISVCVVGFRSFLTDTRVTLVRLGSQRPQVCRFEFTKVGIRNMKANLRDFLLFTLLKITLPSENDLNELFSTEK